MSFKILEQSSKDDGTSHAHRVDILWTPFSKLRRGRRIVRLKELAVFTLQEKKPRLHVSNKRNNDCPFSSDDILRTLEINRWVDECMWIIDFVFLLFIFIFIAGAQHCSCGHYFLWQAWPWELVRDMQCCQQKRLRRYGCTVA